MLALALTGSIAAAQTADRAPVENIGARNSVSNALSPADRISAARSPYTQPEEALNDGAANLAQFPGRQSGPPSSRCGGYARPYPGMWRGSVNGRHIAIGALIGFGIGAALGAKANQDPTPGATVKASLLFGSVVGVLGALIGQGAPAYARLKRPRQRGTDRHSADQDEMALAVPAPPGQPVPAGEPKSPSGASHMQAPKASFQE